MVTNIIEFNGIDQITSSYKVASDLGTNFINIDTEGKTLRSAKDYLDTGISMSGNTYWYKAPNYDLESTEPLNDVYHNGFVYTTSKGLDNTSVLTRYLNGVPSIVGTPAPDMTISISENGGYYREAGFVWANYYYAFTYYDSETGEESQPQLTDVFSAEQKVINLYLSNIDTTQDKLRIFRVGNYITKFTLVTEIDISSSSLNYSDDNPDTALSILLNTRDTITPPVGLCNLTSHNGIFYASKGSRLRYSKPGNANSWEALAYLDMEADILGLSSVNGILLIFLPDKVYGLLGSSIADYHLMTLLGDTGLRAELSLVSYRNFAVFLSDNGISITDGNTVQHVSKERYTFADDEVFKDAAVLNDNYYLLSDRYLYEVDFGLSSTPTFRLYDNVTGINSITSYDNILYGIGTNKLKMFKGTEDLTIQYMTPTIVAPYYNYIIELEKISISFKGEFSTTINKSNGIISKDIISDDIDIIDIHSQYRDNKIKNVSLALEGKGEVYAINFKYAIPELENEEQ